MFALAFLLLLGAVIWRYAHGSRVNFARIFASAFKIGGIAFALGFFGPMILAPGANQGPMLGIFITGPLGFLGGLIYGVIREMAQRRS